MNVSTLFFCCLLFLLPPAALQAQEAAYLNPFENAFYLTEKGDQEDFLWRWWITPKKKKSGFNTF